LEELAGAQLSRLVKAALHDQARGVKGSGGAAVVLCRGRVEGAAVEEESELGLSGGSVSVARREAVDDVLQNQPGVGHERLGDPPGVAGRSLRRWSPTVSAARTRRSRSSITPSVSVVAIQKEPQGWGLGW